MKSLYRSSRCESWWASRPDRAWLRTLSQVVMPDVRPPTKDPASADSAERYAASCIYGYYESRHSYYFDPKAALFPSTFFPVGASASCRFNLVSGGRSSLWGRGVSAQELRVVPRSRTPDS